MDYLSMDDDIDLENELLQEQSLYELNYGEEEHAADEHHDILDSEQQLQSNTTTAHRVSSVMSDKFNPMFESSKSVYTQDTSSAIDDYNLFKEYTRYSQVPPVKKQKKTLNPTQFALSIQAERLSALAQSHHTHTHIHASDATFKTADGGFVAVSNRHSNVRSSSKSFLHNYYEDKYAGLATTRPSYHHLHPCEITPYLHSSLATLSMTCESSMVCEGDGDLLSDALHHPSIGIAGKKYLSYRASDYLTCVLNNGDRYYLTRRDGDATAVSSHTTPPLGSKLSSSSLLSKPMKDLLAEVYEEKRTHELMRLSSSSSSSDGTTASTNPISSDAVDAFRPSTASSALLPHHEQKQQQQSPDLWVDKYSPKSFPQLLSPEKINREVLKALKRWDRFVFKSSDASTHTGGDGTNASPSSSSSSASASSAHGHNSNKGMHPNHTKGGSSTYKTSSSSKLPHNHTSDTRPFHKVILLCGAPGTGKTTLAHILAIHCGYHPIEINASDDRSPEMLRDAIARATQNTTLSSDQRPNCIILDEIDGVDGSRNALDVLTNIIKAPLKSSTPPTTGSKQPNNSSVFPLTRPLICICNDQYAPVLKELRQLSDIFVFTAPKELRLVQRLRDICKLEGLHLTNSMCITELCNATGHDIRASINNLQFAAIRSRNQHSIDQHQHHHHHHHPSKNMMDIGRVLQNMIRSGLKDGQLDLFQIWKSIFTVQSPASTTQQQSTSIQSLVEDEANAITSRTQQQLQVKVDCSMKVMDSMQSYGDHQQVISGIFENIHSIDPLDPAFTKHAIGSDWVSFTDELQSFMPTARDGFQLQPYIASVAGAVYCHNSLNRHITLSWPKKDREMHYKGASKQSILQSLLDGSDIHSLRISKNRLVVDVVPYLLDIISPRGARALPMITLSQPEQDVIMNVIHAMDCTGLTYQKVRSNAIPGRPVDANSSRNRDYRSAGRNIDNADGGGDDDEDHHRGDGSDKSSSFHALPYANQYMLVLEPAIHQLLEYTDCDELSNRHVVMTQELRQLINAELRKFSIVAKANKVDSLDDSHSSSSSNYSSATSRGQGSSAKATFKTHSSPSHDVTQEIAHDAVITEAVATISKRSSGMSAGRSGALDSFFKINKKARVVQIGSEDMPSSTLLPSGDKSVARPLPLHKIHFKFNQGFSNAVRRNVTINEFM